VAQTVLRVHTRVADLYNNPMNQTEEQLRLTVEALRERQEHEMINNREIGLLHNADYKQRIHTRNGAPTPDDMDELLVLVHRSPSFFLAHPRAIAAFRPGVHQARHVPRRPSSWRAAASPRGAASRSCRCSKIPISEAPHQLASCSMRVGLENQGVVGLHQTGLPDEIQPGLNVRFMGIERQGHHAVPGQHLLLGRAVLVPEPARARWRCSRASRDRGRARWG
jgi:hypothetical protein